MAKKTGHSIPDQPESWRWPEKQWREVVNKIRAGKSLNPDNLAKWGQSCCCALF